ncbi:aryldialkylphosphatase [Pseudonocardia saturnea]|uniref:Aryldialkylphosphatase n=1 Tax=Pseudonocardia saturnea TaxID=33909 RepID=A0ABQ0RXP0_9PSEU|nr:aryldialkylphosphatase [Pseudonocardia autotrophica]GEC25445.1 aryldialkylphosphatase [Pseudonocardia saturnea]
MQGDVPVGEIGHVQPHEHLFIDLGNTAVQQGTVLASDEEIHLGNYYETRRHHSAYSVVMDSVEVAVQEVREYREFGGDAIVDPTSIGLSRNPEGLEHVSRQTGVHIVMGCGYYYRDYQPPGVGEKSAREIAAEIVHDIGVGVGERRIRAGVIGEIGLSSPLDPQEAIVLEGAVYAQRETGAALMIHPGRDGAAPAEALDVVTSLGGDLGRVVMSHIDRTLFEVDAMADLASSGCYLAFDLFGQESSYYPYGPIDMPNDATRVDYLIELIRRGYGRQLLVAQDICKKAFLRTYGGEGYGHVLRNVIPLMRRKGMTDEQVEMITRENPKRAIALAPGAAGTG